MALDPLASDRVYQDIRKLLFAGEYRLRERLDVATLAAKLNVSTTPVREALFRLAGDRLIASRPGRGFFVSLWSEAELKALYQWRGMLAGLALQAGALARPQLDAGVTYPLRVAALLQSINGATNPELKRAAGNADDRLHAARMAEVELFADAEAELLDLVLAFDEPDRGLGALQIYHLRREAHASALRERAVLRALPPNGN